MKNVQFDKSTTVRPIDQPTHQIPPTVVIDVLTGETGTIKDWVAAFAQVWRAPATHLERLLTLVGDDVTLRAPINPPVTHGKDAARRGFSRVLKALPDLQAETHRWSFANDALFLEMTFTATVGGHSVSWRSVDRFLFKDGIAVERVAYFDPSKLRRSLTRNLGSLAQLWRLRRG